MNVTTTQRVAILGGVRIPFCRNNTAYMDVGNFGMSVKTLGALVEKFDLHGVELGEVAWGAVIKHSSDWNLAREAMLSSGLAPTTPGITTARACGTSLDNAIIIANKIAAGQIEAGIAGGSDTTSDVPIVYGRALQQRLLNVNRAATPMDKFKAALKGFSFGELKPSFPGVAEPRTGMSMGDHCELMAQGMAHLARGSGRARAGEPSESRGGVRARILQGSGRAVPRPRSRRISCAPTRTLEKLAALKPAFDKTSGQGTLTAGNSTGLSDGASAVLLASDEWAATRGLKPQAYLTYAQVAAVDFVHGEGLLMAPTIAVPRMLAQAGLTLQDFDFFEIHEAFAAQVLCTLRAWESADYCRNRLGLDKPLGIDRSGQAQRQRIEPGARPSVRGDRHAHRRHAGENAGGKGIGPRPDFDLHRRRHGRHGHRRTAVT